MEKNRVQIKYCLLGYGYASLVAYQKLQKKHPHQDILILKDEKFDPIFTIDHQGVDFSPPLPIFPVKESELYQSDLFDDVPKQDPISVQFSDLSNFDPDLDQVKEGSLADFMIKKQGVDRNLCLGGLKQWGGPTMLHRPFSQVQSKINRHYISNKGNTRMGYVNGLSLFKYAVEKLQPQVLGYSGIEKIDLEAKELHTSQHIISFEQLISTIPPLHYLLAHCQLPPHDHDTESAAAYFKFFSYDGGFAENQIIYDCDLQSEILRLFSVNDTLLMAQIRGDAYGQVATEKIQARVQQLIPEIKGLQFARELYSRMGYPLELVDQPPQSVQSLATLKKHGIIPPLGRFGNWEYSDLHELDWASIV